MPLRTGDGRKRAGRRVVVALSRWARAALSPCLALGLSLAPLLAPLLALLLALPLAAPALASHGGSHAWIDAAGGFFTTPSNWSSAALPGAGDIATFDLGGPAGYTVSFLSDATTRRLVIGDDDLTLNLTSIGFRYDLTESDGALGSLVLGLDAADDARLTLIGGTLAGVNAILGGAPGSSAALTVSTANALELSADLRLNLGSLLSVGGNGAVSVGNRLDIGPGATVDVGSGTLTVGPGAAATGAGTVRLQAGGTIDLAGGTLSAAQFDFSGGALSGSGTIVGTAIFGPDATVSHGAGPGVLNFSGDAGFDGALNIKIGGILLDGGVLSLTEINTASGPAGTEFGQVNVFGEAVLNGSLAIGISLVEGVTLAAGSFFDILTADRIVADLSGLNLTFPGVASFSTEIVTLADPTRAGATRQALRVTIGTSATAVPEPGTLALFGMGLVLLGGLRRLSKRFAHAMRGA